MSDKIIWVELHVETRLPVAILKNSKHASHVANTAQMLRSVATGSIRQQVYERDGRACTHCGAPVTPDTMHMHERLWRGRGGEISLENSTTLCGYCHEHSEVAGHGKRRVQWSHNGNT